MTRQQWLGKAYNSARWGMHAAEQWRRHLIAQIMLFNCVSKRTVLCSGKVVGEATPGVPRLPLSHHQDGGWSWEARELSGSTAGLGKPQVFCPEDRKSFAPSVDGAFRSLNVWRWYGQEDRCWRQPTGHFFLTVWSQISQRLGCWILSPNSTSLHAEFLTLSISEWNFLLK